MEFVVTGTAAQMLELKGKNEEDTWISAADVAAWQNHTTADAFFNLHDDAAKASYSGLTGAIFINSVVNTLSGASLPANVLRFNGWPGFIGRPVWEIAGDVSEKHKAVCEKLTKKIMQLPDQPGFVSARVIGMIINEAFFAKEDGVSEEAEIDIAMKLGTNYPFGPFEWGKAIGLRNVSALLNELAKQDERYIACKLLLESSDRP